MSSSTKIVSIVDDELDITELFHDAVCDSIDGVSVVSFNDPVIALEHFTQNKERYALVISDFRMPNLTGLELLKKVKKFRSNVRTILVSAYEVEYNAVFQRYMQESIIDSFIEKPVTINQLCQRVRDEFQVYQLATASQLK
ncbi:MAG: response regulator [Nitrososphaeraceae archaeon]|jgi:DNA-binding NtrC family response regulator|nr:response regulator [Nitrososphaeraceae archaeon]RPJ23734.1 MAG: response regulator [Nitrosopumilales archaeon]MDW0139318.1 response regulator [Nitrososphaeraceae archaeon]MDW0141640.1 response regulator [Nitrososphaeraceae archaeon]MDW0144771.1 response regulator [Nitrososphaeraceae archaeon]